MVGRYVCVNRLAISLLLLTMMAAIPTVVSADTNLGQMDLDGYCKSLGNRGVMLAGKTVYDWYCTSNSGGRVGISINAACNWQYHRSDAYSMWDDFNNPYGMKCYAPTSGSSGSSQLRLPIYYFNQYPPGDMRTYDCDVAASLQVYLYLVERRPGDLTLSLADAFGALRDDTGNWNSDFNFDDVEKVLQDLRLQTTRLRTNTSDNSDTPMQAMRDAIHYGYPVIALVHGADLNRDDIVDGKSYADHWVVVTGISNTTVWFNDPDDQSGRNSRGQMKNPNWIHGGEQVALDYSIFRSAVWNARGNSGAYGIVVHK